METCPTATVLLDIDISLILLAIAFRTQLVILRPVPHIMTYEWESYALNHKPATTALPMSEFELDTTSLNSYYLLV